jgi:hypothetical protein
LFARILRWRSYYDVLVFRTTVMLRGALLPAALVRREGMAEKSMIGLER